MEYSILYKVMALAIVLLFAAAFLIYGKQETYQLGKQSIRRLSGLTFWIYGLVLLSLVSSVSTLWGQSWLVDSWEVPLALRWVGLGLGVGGVFILYRAKKCIGENYSPCTHSYLPNFIVTHGIYEIIRHPIYTGNLIFLGGVSLMSGAPLTVGALLILGVIYFRTTAFEEEALCRQFPAYRSYQKTAGRFLPRLIT